MAARPVGLFDAFLLLTLICFWGSSFVVVKIALREGLTPIAIATFRFLTAGGLFLIALLLEKTRKRDYRLLIQRKDAVTLLFLALSGVTFFFAAQYTGINLAGATIAAIVVCLLSPILITVFSNIIFKDQMNKRQVLGVGTAAAGTFVVTVGGTFSLQFNRDFMVGSLVLLLTPVLWTAYSLMGRKTLEKYNPFLIVAYVTILGGLCLIPFSLAENSFSRMLTISLNCWLAIIYLASTCSVLGYYIWFYSLKHVGAAATSSFLFAEPVVTGLLAVTLVGETLTLPIVAGAALIFIGVYLITRNQKRN
jgi:drug/metabolite transporter (DMT)-like permease